MEEYIKKLEGMLLSEKFEGYVTRRDISQCLLNIHKIQEIKLKTNRYKILELLESGINKTDIKEMRDNLKEIQRLMT